MAGHGLGSQVAIGVIEGSKRQQIMVGSIDRSDCSLCALKLGLAEFNDGAKTQVVAGSSQSLCGLIARLFSHADAAECNLRVQEVDPYVASYCGPRELVVAFVAFSLSLASYAWRRNGIR